MGSSTNHWRTPPFFKMVKSPPTRLTWLFLMGKFTISMDIFNSFLYVYQAGFFYHWLQDQLGSVTKTVAQHGSSDLAEVASALALAPRRRSDPWCPWKTLPFWLRWWVCPRAWAPAIWLGRNCLISSTGFRVVVKVRIVPSPKIQNVNPLFNYGLWFLGVEQKRLLGFSKNGNELVFSWNSRTGEAATYLRSTTIYIIYNIL